MKTSRAFNPMRFGSSYLSLPRPPSLPTRARVGAVATAIALGVHGADFDLDGAGSNPSTVTLNTQASGSSIILITFGEFSNYSIGADNKSNTYTQLHQQGYAGGLWPGFGQEVYAKANAAGGSSHTATLTKTGTATNETTLIMVEARGTVVQASSAVARAAAGAGVAYTSASVTTTGPALLIASWGGDGDTTHDSQLATPEAGWTVIEGLDLGHTAYIQAQVAVKQVSAAGTYTCAWTPLENQGGSLVLVAVQA